MHFFRKLTLAAPASFFSPDCVLQVVLASVTHLPMKLVLAAPANFFWLASRLQVAPAAMAAAGAAATGAGAFGAAGAGAAVCATAAVIRPAAKVAASAKTFIRSLPWDCSEYQHDGETPTGVPAALRLSKPDCSLNKRCNQPNAALILAKSPHRTPHFDARPPPATQFFPCFVSRAPKMPNGRPCPERPPKVQTCRARRLRRASARPHNRVAAHRRRAAADGRSSARDLRSFPSTARSTRPCARRRRAP